jgi:predicted double-glycine peptidase
VSLLRKSLLPLPLRAATVGRATIRALDKGERLPFGELGEEKRRYERARDRFDQRAGRWRSLSIVRNSAVCEKVRRESRAFFFLLLAVAGAAAAEHVGPVRSLLEIRQTNVIVQQWDVSCGAAALATLLTYHHGDPVSEKAVAQAMLGKTDPLRVKVRGGFSLLDLKRYAEARGFQADGYMDVSLTDLAKFGPAIVPVTLDGYPHFVVFRARIGDRVLIADPAFGNRSVEVAIFEKAWQKIAFVVDRRSNTPPSRLGPRLQDELRPSADMIRRALR